MTTALEGVRCQRHAPAAIYPRERPGTRRTGGWVCPRAGLDRCGKSHPPPGFDPGAVQPVASRYTDYATRPTYLIVVLAIVSSDPEESRITPFRKSCVRTKR